MRGYELTDRLRLVFAASGTAGSPVMFRNTETGEIFQIDEVSTEMHEDADGSTTHWIDGTPI